MNITCSICKVCVVIAIVLVAGCKQPDPSPRQGEWQPYQPLPAVRVISTIDDAAKRSEPAISAIEDAAGRTIAPETSSRVAGALEKAQDVVGKGAGAAAIGSKVPGPWQPYLTGIAGVLAALNGLLGTVAVIFRRRQRRAEGAFSTVAEGIEAVKRKDGEAAELVTSAIKVKAAENGNLADVKDAVRRLA